MEPVESAKCECCELREDCARGYIVGVKADFGGRWLCGLCSEAVREEGRKRGMEAALQDHMAFCAGWCRGKDPALRVADGMRQMLLRRRRPISISK
ncbi:unnamed protein product [Triticum turgidum subsp. durum]|uniref:Uncharacterized protein n=1 Tax=Triticum turgidum subsp. durum TaxID=4567 RepID=A0A9R0WEV7_TRITD|nr:unnamed protein product [Triticum turgidum subsp. durum]